MKKAIAIVAYDRPAYLERVLVSILSQKIDGRAVTEIYDVHGFQDGLWQGADEKSQEGHRRVTELLREALPADRVVVQSENLAVALHFDFIERRLYEGQDYGFVTFCEDDMVLAPGYMQAMDRMAERFAEDPRVGMFSANPADVTRPLERQRAEADRYTSMAHNWGFGLSRSFWRKRQVFVDQYLKWARAFPYRQRPNQEICEWLGLAGFKPLVSSQDFVKSCTTVALGAVRIATSVNYGMPIGEVGLHSTPELFRKLGYDRTVVYDASLNDVPLLDDATYQALLRAEAANLLIDGEHFNRVGWNERVRTGAFDPESRINAVLLQRDPLALATEADVMACYRMVLGRMPENPEVVKARVGQPLVPMLLGFLGSPEFSSRRRDLADAISRTVAGSGEGAEVSGIRLSEGPSERESEQAPPTRADLDWAYAYYHASWPRASESPVSVQSRAGLRNALFGADEATRAQGIPLGLGEFTCWKRSGRRIFVLGNCQAPEVARCLASMTEASVFGIEVMRAVEKSDPDFLFELMESSDVIVTASIGADWGRFATESLRNTFPKKVLSFTSVYYAGVHPDITYLGEYGERILSPLGDYHSKIVIASYLAGLSELACARKFTAAGFEEAGYLTVRDESIAEYLRRDRDVDIRWAEQFLQRVVDSPLLNTVNHPNPTAIGLLAHQIGHEISEPMQAADGIAVPTVLQSDVVWPVHEGWSVIAGLAYRTPPVFWRRHYMMTLDEFIWRSYRLYDQRGREALVRCTEGRGVPSF